MKNWKISNTLKNENIENLVTLLLENRGIKTKKDKETFLHPSLESVTVENVGIDQKQLTKTIKRIKKAIDEQEQIVVFGDYDVDGITGTAILWETLFALKAKVTPYIPSRIDEGYGLSVIGIKNLDVKSKDTKLIITVDNGIVANEAVEFANTQGIDVIITDHHTVGKKLPKAYSIVHTTKLCGAGVAWILSKEITGSRIKSGMTENDTYLELATLGTVADLVPLTGANRAIVKHGLPKVCQSKRPGLQELCKQAGLEKDIFAVYDISYVIAPRLNASGRIESAMDSLRLLCTKSPERAKALAEKLEKTNKQRQILMRDATDHAMLGFGNQGAGSRKLLIVSHESYQEGVIGLVAGRLVEAFYRPSIVISKGEKHSKGSVRSISGFNVIEFLRLQPELFLSLGGHPMAAGFTVETEKLLTLTETFEQMAEELVDEALLIRSLKIDCELPLSAVSQEFYDGIQRLAPFGMGNPEPVFVSRGVKVEDMRVIGKEKNHLKLVVKDSGQARMTFDAIAFGMGELADNLEIGGKIDLAYSIDENTWNGNTKLQLKVKDIAVV